MDRIQSLLVGGDEERVEINAPDDGGRDHIDDVMDDPNFRPQIKQAIFESAQRGWQGTQPQEQRQAPPDPMQQNLDRQTELIAEQKAFFDKPEAERDYQEYEKSKLEVAELQAAYQRAQREQSQRRASLLDPYRVDQIVGDYIEKEARSQASRFGKAVIKDYEARIRDVVRKLPEQHLAGEQALLAVLPNIDALAFKEHVAKPRAGRGRDASQGYDGQDDRPRTDEFADASAEEKEFLRAMGLIGGGEEKKETMREVRTASGRQAFVLDVGRGRQNK
jgi:hypothetical protein